MSDVIHKFSRRLWPACAICHGRVNMCEIRAIGRKYSSVKDVELFVYCHGRMRTCNLGTISPYDRMEIFLESWLRRIDLNGRLFVPGRTSEFTQVYVDGWLTVSIPKEAGVVTDIVAVASQPEHTPPQKTVRRPLMRIQPEETNEKEKESDSPDPV